MLNQPKCFIYFIQFTGKTHKYIHTVYKSDLKLVYDEQQHVDGATRVCGFVRTASSYANFVCGCSVIPIAERF